MVDSAPDPEQLLGENPDALLRERARVWALDQSSHLSEPELEALRNALPGEPGPLDHLLHCEDCTMRLRVLSAERAALALSMPARGRRLRRSALAIAAGLLVFFAGRWSLPGASQPAPPAARALSLHDPSALRAGAASEIRRSELQDGLLAILVSCRCAGESIDWEMGPPQGPALRGSHAFGPFSQELKEFVLEADLNRVLTPSTSQLELRILAADGSPCGHWILRVRG